jgi:N utilization substance protein A
VIIDAGSHTMELIVPDEKLSLAIGKKGQNVRLASQLTGWRIDIHSETKVREMEARARQSMAAIKSGGDDGGGLPTTTIEALFQAGFRSASEVAAAKADELAGIAPVGGIAGAQALIVAAAQAAEIERARQLEVEEAARAAREAQALAEPEAAAAPSPGASPEVRHG